jgi:hypothetical protein
MIDELLTSKQLELPNGGSRGLEAVRRQVAVMQDLAEHRQALAAVVRSLEEMERLELADAEATAARELCLQVRLFLEKALLVLRSATTEPV